MKKNESSIDQVVRTIAGIILIGLGLFAGIHGAWQIVVFVLGALLLVTGLVGFCPVYSLFKFSTRKS